MLPQLPPRGGFTLQQANALACAALAAKDAARAGLPSDSDDAIHAAAMDNFAYFRRTPGGPKTAHDVESIRPFYVLVFRRVYLNYITHATLQRGTYLAHCGCILFPEIPDRDLYIGSPICCPMHGHVRIVRYG